MIDIVIVNWNSGGQLRDCIDSIANFSGAAVGKIIVVDNGSSDDSIELLGAPEGVTVISAGLNLGFGRACNLGALKTSADYILFLNPDACVFPETLGAVLSYMNAPLNARAGICGVSLVDESGTIARSCARLPTAARLVAQATGISKFLPSLGCTMFEWDHKKNREVDQVIGAFFVVRRNVFLDLGGFDERFFVYFEEVDFSRRAKDAGWKTVYLANIKAFHAGGGTSNQVKAKRLFYSLRSRLLYAFKHFSKTGAISVLLATALLEPVSRSMLAIGRRSGEALKETWLAYALLRKWIWDVGFSKLFRTSN